MRDFEQILSAKLPLGQDALCLTIFHFLADGFEPDYWATEISEACPRPDSVEIVASSSLTNSMRSGQNL